MEKIFEITIVSVLLNLIAVLVAVFFLVRLIRKAIDEFNSKGIKGILDEVIIGLLLLGVIYFIIFEEGLPAIIKILVDLIKWLWAIINMSISEIKDFTTK